MPVRSAILCVVGILIGAGCGTGPPAIASTGTVASPRSSALPRPTASGPIATVGEMPQPIGSPSVFISPIYGYSISLPAGWSVVKPATEGWDAVSAPGHDTESADLFASTSGTLLWAYSGPTSKSLARFTAAQTAADAAAHPCPAAPETDEAFRVGGEAAQFTVKHCPATDGILVAMTAVIREGTGYLFYFQHPPAAPSRDDDAAVFKMLLAAVVLP